MKGKVEDNHVEGIMLTVRQLYGDLETLRREDARPGGDVSARLEYRDADEVWKDNPRVTWPHNWVRAVLHRRQGELAKLRRRTQADKKAVAHA